MIKHASAVPASNAQQQDITPQSIFTRIPSIEAKIDRAVQQGCLRMLFTDVDSTLVLGAGYHPHEVELSRTQAKQLISQLSDQGFIVIPITGSHFSSGTETTTDVVGRMNAGVLPKPAQDWQVGHFHVDAFVTDGGAQAVLAQNAEALAADPLYGQHLAVSGLSYDHLLSTALNTAQALQTLVPSDLDWSAIRQFDVHAENSVLFLQAGTREGRHRSANKVAFYFYAQTLEDRDLIELQYKKAFEPLGLRVVCCEEKDANAAAVRMFGEASQQPGFPLKYCLDIVPYNKATPVEYFYEYVSLTTAARALESGKSKPDIQVWACGDASNDAPMLGSSVVTHAVIVGGASKELQRFRPQLEASGKWVYTESAPEILGPGSILQALSAAGLR